jgi:hypothetical protein
MVPSAVIFMDVFFVMSVDQETHDAKCHRSSVAVELAEAPALQLPSVPAVATVSHMPVKLQDFSMG